MRPRCESIWRRADTSSFYNPRTQRTLADWIRELRADVVHENLDICIHGVMIVSPPDGDIARENFLKAEATHVWRKSCDHHLPSLASCYKHAKREVLASVASQIFCGTKATRQKANHGPHVRAGKIVDACERVRLGWGQLVRTPCGGTLWGRRVTTWSEDNV